MNNEEMKFKCLMEKCPGNHRYWWEDCPPVAVQGAEHRTSQELFGALAATFHAPPAGSLVMVAANGAHGAGSAFVRNGPWTKPDDASAVESQNTSPTNSSQS